MQIISLDTSLNSTAAVVLDSTKQYHFFNWRKNLNTENVWTQSMPWCNMFNVEYRESDVFTTSENLKLQDYFALASEVFNTVTSYIDLNQPTKILIEGYSQSSKSGRDHDLVAYGTMVRLKFFAQFGDIIILPPMSLKKHAAQLTYQPDSKGVYRNAKGIAGGKFDKFDMGQCLIDHGSADALTAWYNLHWADIKTRSAIPKPADDLCDAMWLNLVGQSNQV